MSTENQFRKKPVVITATQWLKNGDHPQDYALPVQGFEGGESREFSPEHCRENDWEGAVVRRYRTPEMDGQTACKHCGGIMHSHGWIDTLEGGHIVCPGDWIITGVQDERYPCKPDIFAATYDAVAASTNNAKEQIVAAAGDVGENANSLDATADALLTRVAQFFGECVGGDTFCGLGIDEARDENGVLQYLRLVPCDLVNSEPVRRIAK